MVLLSFAYGRGRENLSPSPQHLNRDFRFAMARNDCTSNASFRELFSVLSIPSNSGGPGKAQFGIFGVSKRPELPSVRVGTKDLSI
jgi:hypothetical protein